jgi:hypothetical protein
MTTVIATAAQVPTRPGPRLPENLTTVIAANTTIARDGVRAAEVAGDGGGLSSTRAPVQPRHTGWPT